jgi:drug/metabolite transporter (DMT)-like permease
VYTDRFTARAAYDALLAAGFVVTWSSGFIGATLGTRAASVQTLLMWRFVIGAPVLVLWAVRRPLRRLGGRALALHSVLGVLSQGVYLGAIVSAVALGVSAGVAALIAALQPIAAAALAGPILGERVIRRQWLGLAVGLVGVAVVVAGDLAADHAAPAWAYALPFTGMAGLVAATLLERRTAPRGTVAQGLAVQCGVSAVLFTAVAAMAGDVAPPADPAFWAAIAWVILLSTVGGYGLYWLNLRRSSVTTVSSLLYLTPPTTLVWGLLMFGEPIGVTTLAGLAICLAGVLLVRRINA